ncbi:MAG: CDP-diacylglycerol--serine O-phosphatidyltransferase [Leptospiraceae bacterium]|nr:CDP-diacylglycerol--serine O-phosphatidyltransferase [Leptospiraceae bacterium]
MKSKLSWIPNTLTLGNLTLGFVSIVLSSEAGRFFPESNQPFLLSGIFIILAALFDGFDGMAARALNATSEVGAELDSLADLTTFGIAPGYLMYKMILFDFTLSIGDSNLTYGILIAAIFPICAAYRLARFNAAHDPGSFTGLPSPVAGVIVGLFPVSFHLDQIPNYLTLPAFIVIALLMVSTIKYSKPQVAMRGKFTKERMIVIILGLAILFFFIGFHRIPWLLYGIIIFYVFSGIISLIIHLIQDYKL